MQVYRGLDIGTAKPPRETLDRIPHHLIDICDPWEQFNAGRFVEEANRLISEIESRAALPVVSGGTAFYFKNLLYGLPGTPPATPATRGELRRELRERGLPALYGELKVVDPESAERIEPRDEYRILRALEVYRETGRPRSAYVEAAAPRDDLRFRAVGLYRDRRRLYERIDRRVEQMFAAGLPGEITELLRAGVTREMPAMRAIGYKEFFAGAPEQALAEGRIGANELEIIKREIKKNSRRYAKRQLTFFGKLPGVIWLEAEQLGELPGIAEQLLQET